MLLMQVDDSLGDKELRKVMTVGSLSGGDSSAKVAPSPTGDHSHKLVTYSKDPNGLYSLLTNIWSCAFAWVDNC